MKNEKDKNFLADTLIEIGQRVTGLQDEIIGLQHDVIKAEGEIAQKNATIRSYITQIDELKVKQASYVDDLRKQFNERISVLEKNITSEVNYRIELHKKNDVLKESLQIAKDLIEEAGLSRKFQNRLIKMHDRKEAEKSKMNSGFGCSAPSHGINYCR
jgi:chromosome segregation ATPase